MLRNFSSSTRVIVLACAGWLVAGCTEPAADPLGPAAPQVGVRAFVDGGASVEFQEYAFPLNFPSVPVACLNSDVLITGTIFGWDRTVTRPNGSGHVTTFWDVSNVRIELGDQVWTAGPGSSEIFVWTFEAGGIERVHHHLGAVIFRAGNGRPELQLYHQIQRVTPPGAEEPELFRNIFEIRCVAPNR